MQGGQAVTDIPFKSFGDYAFILAFHCKDPHSLLVLEPGTLDVLELAGQNAGTDRGMVDYDDPGVREQLLCPDLLLVLHHIGYIPESMVQPAAERAQ